MQLNVWIRSLFTLLLLFGSAYSDDFTVQFTVQFEPGHVGEIVVTVREAKAPIGARRFRELVNSRFFDGAAFYRVVPGFLAQFGISPNSTLQHFWDRRGNIPDEVRIEHPDWNMRGTLAFHTSGANSRNTQLIFNFDDNHVLDAKGFVPFGRIVRGMGYLSRIYSGYRERPEAAEMRRHGNAYLQAEFPKLSVILEAKQVAFVEEPIVLSKNFTGFLITVKGYKKTAGETLYEVDFEDDDADDADDHAHDDPHRGSAEEKQRGLGID